MYVYFCESMVVLYLKMKMRDFMRIELEDENKKKQQEEQTCQQLSQKHESDLTKKEKRLLEKEKLKAMDWKGKLQYIWMYYKVWIFVAIGVVFLAFGIRSWIENARIKTVLSIAVTDSAGSDSETVEENLKELLGIDQDPYQKVDITETFVTNEDGTQLDTYSQVAFVTKVQAQAFDVALMPEALCSSLEKEGYFMDLDQLLDQDTLQAAGQKIQGNHILVSDQSLKEQFGVEYEPVCVAVLVNAQNTEAASKWLKQLLM